MGSAADVSANVEAISTYTIATSGGTITISVFNTFYALATDQVELDDPGFTSDQYTEAQALYVCHLIARKKGQTGKTSLSIGKYSYSKMLKSGLTSWLDEYHALIDRVKTGGMITVTDLLGDDGHGIDHLDYTESQKVGLDQEPIRGGVNVDTIDPSTDSDYFYGGD